MKLSLLSAQKDKSGESTKALLLISYQSQVPLQAMLALVFPVHNTDVGFPATNVYAISKMYYPAAAQQCSLGK